MKNFLDLLGRIFISVIFLYSGTNKILNYEITFQWIEIFEILKFLLVFTVIMEIIFPVFIIIGYKTKIAAIALSIYCLSTAFIFHNDFSSQTQIITFLQNISLTGALILMIVNGTKDWALEKKRKYVRL